MVGFSRSESRHVPLAAAIAFALATAMIVGVVAIAAGLLDDTPEDDAIIDIVDAISAESAAVSYTHPPSPRDQRGSRMPSSA